MQFNTLVYLAFLAVAVVGLRHVPERARKGWLVLASLVFYASWHVEYVALLLAVGVVAGYGGAYVLAAEGRARRLRGYAVITVLVGILSAFKYADWGAANVGAVARHFGSTWAPRGLGWILPLGVSFYTFEGISYIAECIRGKEKRHSFLDFQLYIAFFPHLVAGPILRAKELIPQFNSPKWRTSSSETADGIWLLASGFFLKNVLADWLAPRVDRAFAHTTSALGAADVLVMAVGFALQIYFDFSSYSRMAIGSAKLCGIQLVDNFRFPFRARTPADFWNRWHISLSRWVRDYLFFPLSGRRLTVAGACRASIITMTLCGLWHGAGWTYVVWGFYHGMLLAAYYVGRAWVRPAPGPELPPPHWFDSPAGIAVSSALTWVFLLPSWILFRVPTLRGAWDLLSVMLTPARHPGRTLDPAFYLQVTTLMCGVWAAPFVVDRVKKRLTELRGQSSSQPLVFAMGVFTGILMFAALAFRRLNVNRAFIYFQF